MATRRKGTGILVFAIIVAGINGFAFGGKFAPANPDAGGVLIGLAAFLSIMLGLLPAYIAGRRGHQKYLAILVLNILIGWNGFGWIVAIVWACTEVRTPIPILSAANQAFPPQLPSTIGGGVGAPNPSVPT
jgi:hypothetical protein